MHTNDDEIKAEGPEPIELDDVLGPGPNGSAGAVESPTVATGDARGRGGAAAIPTDATILDSLAAMHPGSDDYLARHKEAAKAIDVTMARLDKALNARRQLAAEEAEASAGPLHSLTGEVQHVGRHQVFLHEGPRTAERVRSMLNVERLPPFDIKLLHPWRADLLNAAHIGWHGAVDSVDWTPLVDAPPHVKVTVVATYDSGEHVVSAISKRLMRPLTVVRFDDHFPPGFDLTHPWPNHEDWWRTDSREYCGPTLDDLSSSATWATEVVPVTVKRLGRPAHRLRKEFTNEWFTSVDPPVFVHRDHRNLLLNNDRFNRAVRPFSDVEDTAKLMVKAGGRARVKGIVYRPSGERVLTIERLRFVNTYRPSEILPSRGDAAPWLNFLEHLFPVAADRDKVMRWCATLIARPDIRMLYGMLLISETQGVGKTTLGTILARLIGMWNVSHPNEAAVCNKQFNSWKAHKRLAIVNEIYSGHSRDAYDRLKETITDDIVNVNEKFIPAYDVENWIHIFACSNSLKALHLDDEDRRWLVPTVSEETRPEAYWVEFYRWLDEGGLAVIAHWAREFVAKHGPVRKGEHAPMTSRKQEVIRESRSEGQQMARDLAEAAMAQGRPVVLIVREVRAWIAEMRGLKPSDTKLEKPLTIRKALLAAGMHEPPRLEGKEDNRITVDGRPEYIVSTSPIDPNVTWSAVKDAHFLPGRLLKLAPEMPMVM